MLTGPRRRRHRGRQGADRRSRCSPSTRRRRASRRDAQPRRRLPAGVGRLVAGDPSGEPGRRQAALGRGDAGLPAAGADPELDRRRRLHGPLLDTAEALAQGTPPAGRDGAPETPVAPMPDGGRRTALDARPAPVFEIKAKGKAFVDFQHDVTAEDVRLAHREGYVSVEHLKRYTTLGMATDQGKTSNVPGLAIMADALGVPIHEVGTTRFRAAVLAGVAGLARGRALRRAEARAADADARLACRAGRADVCRRAVVPADDLRPARRERRAGLCARGARGARERWHRRRLHAWQDRRARPGCGSLPRPRLHQHVLDARRRQGALRADAARGRHRCSTTAPPGGSATTIS